VVRGILLSLASVAALAPGACQTKDSPAAVLSHQVRALAEQTTPPGGTATVAPGTATRGGAGAVWTVQASMSWKDYAFWLEGRLHGRYRTIAAEHGALVFSRPLTGDLYTLRASVRSHGPPLLVTFEFQAMPY
jgi:hypothetical protein